MLNAYENATGCGDSLGKRMNAEIYIKTKISSEDTYKQKLNSIVSLFSTFTATTLSNPPVPGHSIPLSLIH